MAKKSSGKYRTRSGRSSVRFVGEVVDGDAPPVPKKRKSAEPVWRSDVVAGAADSRSLPDPTLGVRALYRSSFAGLAWVWWSCTICKRTRYGVHWWALWWGCDHEGGWHEPTNNNPKGFSNESIHGTFASWCRSMGLTLPRALKEIVEEASPWT
jgi:hypothetical protein